MGHMGIDHTTDPLNVMGQLCRQSIGLLIIGAANSDIDGRGLAEIQHLINDIGRLKEELQNGELLRQLAAQGRNQLGRGLVLFF